LYKPLYPPEGQPCLGFKCCADDGLCQGAVTRTEKGIRLHLVVVHGIRFQARLFNDEPDPVAARDLPREVRA
jgi:hypothetical protein